MSSSQLETVKKEEKDPFEGMKRKRLPFIHMVSALDGEVPLLDALAAFFFLMLHDRVKHNCLISGMLEEMRKERDEALIKMKSPDSMALANVFSHMGISSWVGEEWSYISDEDAHIFYVIAGTAIEQTQRWIMEGVQDTMGLPRGPAVLQPPWAQDFYRSEHVRGQKFRVEARELVQKLLKEIEEGKKE